MLLETTHQSWKTGWGIFLKKYLIFLSSVGTLFFYGAYTSVFAEVDPVKLAEILSQLAGTGVTIPTVSPVSNGSGSSKVVTLAKIDHLEISMSPTGNVWEPMDITVRAVTKSGDIVPDYKGTVLIDVKNDYKATISYVDGYTFTSSDKGKKTFSKGISFSKAGTFKVEVSDFYAVNLTGSASVIISEEKEIVSEKNTSPSFKILKVETGDKKVTVTFKVLDEIPDIQKFEFLYADNEGNSNKVLTYEKERIKNTNGEYVWYIPNLELTKYTVSIAWVGENGETLSGVISQPFTADLSLLSAGKCIIPNVSGLRVLEKKDTSVLYWDSIPEAVSYKVYKKNAQGEYMFLEDTKKDSYTIYVADGSVKYEEFSVKAICSDGTESLQFAPSTNVRTGPSEVILLMLISAVISFVIVRKRKKSLKI